VSTTWTCPSEWEWGRLALNPAMEGAEELRRHLEACELCRFVFAEAQDEQAELARVWQEAAGAGPRVIRLSVYQPEAEDARPGVLLAAQGMSEAGKAQAVTLASDEHPYLLRILRDARSGELWLYLLADEPNPTGQVVVSPFGGQETFVTDERGRVNLGRREWPAKEALTAEVRLPLAKFTLSPVSGRDAADSKSILTSPRGDRLEVTLTGMEHARKLRIVLLESPDLAGKGPLRLGLAERGPGGSLRVEPLVSHEAVFDASGSLPEFEIYLFS
jgi:hypothetical protein